MNTPNFSQAQIETLVFRREEIERLARRHVAVAATLAKCEATRTNVSRNIATAKGRMKAGKATEKEAGSLPGHELQIVLLRRSGSVHREELAVLRGKAGAQIDALAVDFPHIAARVEPGMVELDCVDALQRAAAAITNALQDGPTRAVNKHPKAAETTR